MAMSLSAEPMSSLPLPATVDMEISAVRAQAAVVRSLLDEPRVP